MWKVRFNLGKGCNFMKWKIVNTVTGDTQYIDPATHSLYISNATLANRKAAAISINEGHNKYPCAWIIAEYVEVCKTIGVKFESIINEIKYNPRVNPFWSLEGKDVDNSNYHRVVTLGNKVFINTI